MYRGFSDTISASRKIDMINPNKNPIKNLLERMERNSILMSWVNASNPKYVFCNIADTTENTFLNDEVFFYI